MISYAIGTFQDLLSALRPQRRSFLLRHVIKPVQGTDRWLDADALGPFELLSLSLADWLAGEKLTSDDDQQVILTEYRDALADFAKAFEADYDEGGSKFPAVTFGVLDRRFASMPGPGLYDLKEGQWLSELPFNAVTLVYCDLSALLLRLLKNIERANVQQHPAAKPGGAAEAG
jgi:hypothetical protein